MTMVQRRFNLVRDTAYRWVVANRPDVLEAIKAEAHKKYPLKFKRIGLPESVKKLR